MKSIKVSEFKSTISWSLGGLTQEVTFTTKLLKPHINYTLLSVCVVQFSLLKGLSDPGSNSFSFIWEKTFGLVQGIFIFILDRTSDLVMDYYSSHFKTPSFRFPKKKILGQVWFQTGSKSTLHTHNPKLKISKLLVTVYILKPAFLLCTQQTQTFHF